MNYSEAVSYIKDKGKFGSKPGLEVISSLLQKMGDPQKAFKCVHIAGTNGKGSTASYIRNILSASGYITGLFSSPPIICETERIQIDGKFIDEKDFTEITEYVKPFADEVEKDGLHYPTEFELFTAVAFEYFKRKKIDIAVVEVGMGGRLDATNVCVPALSVITNIGLDHTEWLGDTLKKIAFEKAGIIKNGVPVVLYPDEDESVRKVIKSVSKDRFCVLYDSAYAAVKVNNSDITGNKFSYKFKTHSFTNVNIKLLGLHQIKNCTTALTAAIALKENGYKNITRKSIYEGLYNTKWQGRFEIRGEKPLLIFDGGHNEQCMTALVSCVDMYLKDYRKYLVFSMFADKDCTNSIKLLKGKFDFRIVCEMKHKRRATAEYISSLFEEDTVIVKDPKEAVEEALRLARKTEEEGIKSAVVVCGSLNLLEEILSK